MRPQQANTERNRTARRDQFRCLPWRVSPRGAVSLSLDSPVLVQPSVCHARLRRYAVGVSPVSLRKGGGERTRLAKYDIESNFRHRQLALTQQGLGSLNALPGQVSVRRHAERLFERSGKMKRA